MGSYPPSLVNFRGPLLRRLVGAGHEVIAMAPDARGVSQQLAEIGVRFVPVDVDRAGMDPRRDLSMQRRVTSILQEHMTDVFLAYTIKPVVWGIPAARRAGVAHRVALVTGVGHAIAELPRWHPVAVVSRMLYWRALRHATQVVFQNPDDRDDFVRARLVEQGKTRLVAGSGVDLTHFRPVDMPTSPPVRFLLVARLLSTKGIREYVDAARMVLAANSACEFHLVGPTDPNPAGLSMAEIESWVDEGVIDYHGAANDVRDHLAACHVYVLPSYREGTPRSVLEAMAIGRPVITTDVPGCRETVDAGRNGMLVSSKDAMALADAMMLLASNDQMRRRMAAESRRLAEHRFDAECVVDDMMAALGLTR